MTKEEYKNKINELNKQKDILDTQINKVNKEFRDCLLKELEEQGITSGTKVLVRTRTLYGDEVDTVTYFFGYLSNLGR